MVWNTFFPPKQSRLAWVALFVCGGFLLGCEVVQNEQDLAAESLDVNVFASQIMPILTRPRTEGACSNSGCHLTGVGPGGLLRIIPDAEPDTSDMDANFASVAAFVKINDPANSKLLLEPLAGTTAISGSHGGGDIFPDTSDPDYQTILEWISNPIEQQAQ